MVSSPYGMYISLCVFQNIALTLTTGNDTTSGGKWIKYGAVNNPDGINEVCSVFIFSWFIYLVLILCLKNSEILYGGIVWWHLVLVSYGVGMGIGWIVFVWNME